jgi:penicillin-binding protein-related factor A (putative recombinase)
MSLALPVNKLSSIKLNVPTVPLKVNTSLALKRRSKRKRDGSGKLTGRTYQDEIARSFEAYTKRTGISFELERVWDLDDYIGKSCPRCRAPIDHCHRCGFPLPRLGMMPPPRKADFYLTYNGLTVYIEAKSYRSAWGYVVSYGGRENIKEHQIISLKNHVSHGGLSDLFFCERWHKTDHVQHIVPIMDFLELMKGRKKIEWSRLRGVSVCSSNVEYDIDGLRYFDIGDYVSYLDSMKVKPHKYQTIWSPTVPEIKKHLEKVKKDAHYLPRIVNNDDMPIG